MFGPSPGPLCVRLLPLKVVAINNQLAVLAAGNNQKDTSTKMDPALPARPVTGTGTRTRHALPAVRLPGPQPPGGSLLLIELESGPATNQHTGRAAAHRQVQCQPPPGPPRRAGADRLAAHTSDGRSKQATLTGHGWAQLRGCCNRQMDEAMAETPWPSYRPRRARAALGGHAPLSQRPLPRPSPAGLSHQAHSAWRTMPPSPPWIRAVSAEYGLTADKGLRGGGSQARLPP